ncbi:MAG TPA: bifunctional DNA-formamidopyrimidine glycosylase/DNA-(apurinic or apyrimidinic site) lyase, partial [Alphaproteobacteria bacterium]|nr:bifunctional DNA-formamidopyrimidine glycosylase/DNA-(apurinic or apyrimidinic site) lyase [Alphaproteobacteria bacterium]
MPELPEVETVRAGLEKTIKGKTIKGVFTSGKKMREMPSKSDLQKLKNTVIKNIERRSKYLLIRLSNSNILIIHLGMRGKVIFKDNNYKPQKHDHLIL